MPTKVYNPILPGFNPDPSILRVGEDYYIATSTFEWFPGVQIHHSRDLVNWEVIARPLCTKEHLDMLGNPSSGGVWAPCLSYDQGIFYLIFTDVKIWSTSAYKDTHNYLTMTTDLTGEWSKPIYLNSSGFDPSLFHDEDGRKWFVNMEWDYRKQGAEQFSGILIQEYDVHQQKLVGESHKIFGGSSIGLVEGPHLYKKEDYYYLLTAEGGTSYEHAVTVARSKHLFGPYELHPNNPLLTAHNQETAIQKAGHGSWVQSKEGKWYLVHLGGRPIGQQRRCILGRETCIQEMVWKEDGWCYLKDGKNIPADYIEIEDSVVKKVESKKTYRFHDKGFLKDFQTLRIPFDDQMMSIYDRPGYLRLYGRESIYSRHHQTLLCRRQTDFDFEVTTTLEFNPTHFQQLAGLIYRYNENNQYYLFMSYDEVVGKKTMNLIQVNQGEYTLLDQHILESTQVELQLIVQGEAGQFAYKEPRDTHFRMIGTTVDTTILSDDYVDEGLGFTGAFVGMAAQDLKNQRSFADFQSFTYYCLS